MGHTQVHYRLLLLHFLLRKRHQKTYMLFTFILLFYSLSAFCSSQKNVTSNIRDKCNKSDRQKGMQFFVLTIVENMHDTHNIEGKGHVLYWWNHISHSKNSGWTNSASTACSKKQLKDAGRQRQGVYISQISAIFLAGRIAFARYDPVLPFWQFCWTRNDLQCRHDTLLVLHYTCVCSLPQLARNQDGDPVAFHLLY